MFSKICKSGHLEISGTESNLTNVELEYATIAIINLKMQSVVLLYVFLINRTKTKSLKNILEI